MNRNIHVKNVQHKGNEVMLGHKFKNASEAFIIWVLAANLGYGSELEIPY